MTMGSNGIVDMPLMRHKATAAPSMAIFCLRAIDTNRAEDSVCEVDSAQ